MQMWKNITLKFLFLAVFVSFFTIKVVAQENQDTPTPTPTTANNAATATPTPALPGSGGGASSDSLSYENRLKDATSKKELLRLHEQRLGFPIKQCRSGCNLLGSESSIEKCAQTHNPNFLESKENYLDGGDAKTGGNPTEAKKFEGFASNKTFRPQAATVDEWLENPAKSFWVDDPNVTSLGKGGERARQFLLWTLSSQSIDSSPTILEVWKISRNIALFLVVAVVIMMGISIIVGQRSNFSIGVEVWPRLIRVATYLLFVIFSAAIVLFFIQIADILMEFFIRQLGVRDLFNIFFVDQNANRKLLDSSEIAYRTFLGCSDISTDMVESVRTSKYLVGVTNMTYYFVGIMFLLRKILLWFLLIVSPFLVLMAPFVTIRNIAWIWIGVFFQWVFYGPLFALFLGAISNIWNGIKTLGSATHIPYIFDFSRRHLVGEIVYPTAINILYGGPAQRLGVFNSSNYVDTFAEYVISLLMLWAAILFPWWLLRIFRDYCCDGIMAMKNILLNYYQEWRSGGGPNGPSGSPLNTGFTGLAREITNTFVKEKSTEKTSEIRQQAKFTTSTEVRSAATTELRSSIISSASNLRDIARLETNKVERAATIQSLREISKPNELSRAEDRSRVANIRTELETRASKGDKLAQGIVAAYSANTRVQNEEKQRLLSTISAPSTTEQVVSQNAKISTKQSTQVLGSIYSSMGSSPEIVATIAGESQIPVVTITQVLSNAGDASIQQVAPSEAISRIAALSKVDKAVVKKVMETTMRTVETVDLQSSIANSLTNASRKDLVAVRQVVEAASKVTNIAAPTPEVTRQIATQVGLEEAKVAQIITKTVARVNSKDALLTQVAQKENLTKEVVAKVLDTQLPTVTAPSQYIESQVAIPSTVSIEEYEEVKGMWIQQYEEGEVPTSENILNREAWVETDIIAISNILNKLVSTDKTLAAQALDEVGFILPVFMVNQMRGDELAVYLKAKLEAAKQVKKDLLKEQAIKEKVLQEEEETLLGVARPKVAEKPKEMSMTLEQEIPSEKKSENSTVTQNATPVATENKTQ